MYRRKAFLRYSFLTLLLLGGSFCEAADGPQGVTKEAVLQWVEANREAQPAFQPGEILQLADLEKLRPLLPRGTWRSFTSLRWKY